MFKKPFSISRPLARYGVALLLFGAVATWIGADEPQPRGLRRWAILSSATVQRSGLADLLTAELSKNADLELLERDQVAKVVAELTLDAVMGNTNAETRLKIGQLLRADALMVLNAEGEGGNGALRVMVAECRQGARLCVLELPAAAPPTETVRRLGRLATSLRLRFPLGVEQVIGVTGFVSRNLVHDYDMLQTRYADLLGNALSLQPGVAVVATDEARAIGHETAGETTQLGSRIVPLLVEGEFRMRQMEGKVETVVELGVSLSTGKAARRIESGARPLPEAPAWIATELAGQILKAAAGRTPLGIEEQITAFSGQADEFAKLGDWAHSVQLREAAILLRGDNVEERLRAIAEYNSLSQRPLDIPQSERRRDSARLAQAVGGNVAAYIAALEHLEFLIRTAQIKPDLAVHWAGRLSPAIPCDVPQGGANYWMVGQEQLEQAETANKRFMTEVYPKVLTLPHAPVTHDFLEDWSRPILNAAKLRVDRTYDTKEDLAYFRRVITELVPDGLEVSNQALPGGPRGIPGLEGPGAVTEQEYVAFLQSLAQSRHGVASVQGRYALLYREFIAKQEQPEALRKLLPQTSKLLDDYRNLPYVAHAPQRREDEYMYSRVGDLHRYVQQAADPPRTSAIHTPPPPKPPKRTTGAMRFAPLDSIHLRRRNGTTEAFAKQKWPCGGGSLDIQHITRGGDSLDIYWHSGVLLFMRKPNELEEVLVDKDAGVQDVAWDGRYVWVATCRDGILILEPDGRVAAKVSPADGLPPADRAMRLHPLQSGQVVAIGSFGEQHRAWCAVVNWRPGTPRAAVKLFHEAKRVPLDGEGEEKYGRDPELVFDPHWLHAYRAKGDRPDPLLLVGRYAPSYVGQRHPLLINLHTLQVSVLDCELGAADYHADHSYFSQNGTLLEVSDLSTVWLPPPGEKWPDGSTFRRIALTNPAPVNRNTGWLDTPEKVGTALGGIGLFDGGDGHLYVPGTGALWWYRIDPRTMTGQHLTATSMPEPFGEVHEVFTTAHYGLVARAQDTWYRISVDERAIPAAGEPMDY